MRKKLIATIIAIILLVNIFIPYKANATTLREYQALLEKYRNELNDTNSQISISQEKLNEVRNKIANTEKQLKEAEEEIQRLEEKQFLNIIKYLMEKIFI